MRLFAAACVFAVVGVAAPTLGGPIDPPAGPVQGTMKSLQEIEARTPVTLETCPGDADSLFRIAHPGSYYLVGNVLGVAGKHGVEIEATGVTLDLNGFALVGVDGSLCGVFAPSDVEDVMVHNGRVSQWEEDGIALAVLAGQRSGVVEKVIASRNAGRGIHAGTGAVVRGCTAHDNGDNGISVYSAAVVEACSAFANGRMGISAAAEGATITGCSAGGNGDIGIYISVGGTVTGCSARWNEGTGIWTSYGCTVRGNNAYRNQGDGINVHQGCQVVGNNCHNNNGPTSAGIRVRSDSNRIEGNNVTGNVYGIDVDAAGNIIVCNTARGNTTSAFSIPSGNTYGPIVSGGSGQISSTNPWANFSY